MDWLLQPFSRVVGDMGEMFNGCVYSVKSKTRDNLNPDFGCISKCNLCQLCLIACQIENPIVCILQSNIRISSVHYIPLFDTVEP